jgi:hypothetical protein
MQELRSKLGELIYYQEALQYKADVLDVEAAQERIKRE